MMELRAKSSSDQPRMFGIVKKIIVNLDPNLFLSNPEATHDKAAPNGIIVRAKLNLSSVTSNPFSGEVSLGPDCELHPSDTPYMKEPPLTDGGNLVMHNTHLVVKHIVHLQERPKFVVVR